MVLMWEARPTRTHLAKLSGRGRCASETKDSDRRNRKTGRIAEGGSEHADPPWEEQGRGGCVIWRAIRENRSGYCTGQASIPGMVRQGATVRARGQERRALLGGELGGHLWAAGVARRGRFRYVGR